MSGLTKISTRGGIDGIYIGGSNTAIGEGAEVSLIDAYNSTAIGSGVYVNTPNTIQLGNSMVSTVTTSGVVSATGFVGDGSQLTNINPNGGINGINISGSNTAIGNSAYVLSLIHI